MSVNFTVEHHKSAYEITLLRPDVHQAVSNGDRAVYLLVCNTELLGTYWCVTQSYWVLASFPPESAAGTDCKCALSTPSVLSASPSPGNITHEMDAQVGEKGGLSRIIYGLWLY
jgi:hypothetical protein